MRWKKEIESQSDGLLQTTDQEHATSASTSDEDAWETSDEEEAALSVASKTTFIIIIL